jgi:hypothetical protein
MKRTWDVDDNTVVTVKVGGFGRNSLTVYGVQVPAKLSLRKKSNTSFILKDGRRATLTIKPQFATAPDVELRVDNRLLVETDAKPRQCASCQTAVKPNDQFCTNCGHPMPSGEDHAHQKNVNQAARTIWTLSALFLLSGVVMYVISNSQAAKSAGLIGSLVLVAIMALLALWAKKAHLAALVVATATNCVLIVTSAIVDPRTIAQGLILKIVVITLLVRGIKSALALRVSNA